MATRERQGPAYVLHAFRAAGAGVTMRSGAPLNWGLVAGQTYTCIHMDVPDWKTNPVGALTALHNIKINMILHGKSPLCSQGPAKWM
jgi:hypothetical protein